MDKEGYKLLHRINHTFSEIVLADGGMEQIAQTLADFCRAQVQVIDMADRVILDVSAGPEELRHEDPAGSVKKKVVVNDETETFVRLAKFEGPVEDIDTLALESAAQTIGFIILKDQVAEEVDRQYHHEFLNELVDGGVTSREDIIPRGAYYGYNLHKPYLPMIMNIDSLDGLFPHRDKKDSHKMLRKTFGVVLKTFFSHSRDSIVWSRKSNIIILYPVPGELLEDGGGFAGPIKKWACRTAANIKEGVEKSIDGITLTVGLGTLYQEAAGISQGYREALDAMETGKTVWGSGRVYHYSDLGIYKVFVKYPDKKDLAAFVEETVGPLMAYDRGSKTNFLGTLEELLDNCGNQKRTAEKLFIHPKTLAYRKGKIEKILGISLDDAGDVLNAHTAVKIRKALGKKYFSKQ